MLAPICIFIILLFVYVHIRYHIRPGTEPIIYELMDPSRALLHDTIHHKQPVKFSTSLGDEIGLEWGQIVRTHSTYHVNVSGDGGATVVEMPVVGLREGGEGMDGEDGEDGADGTGGTDTTTIHTTPTNHHHLLYGNERFIDETSLAEKFTNVSHMLRPHMMTRATYDLIGSVDDVGTDQPTRTPHAHTHTVPTASSAHITYLICTAGSVNVRLCSGKYTSRICRNASLAEKISHLSFWDNSGNIVNEELLAQIDTQDTVVGPGYAIAIPAHWWYSLELSPDTSVAMLRYRSAMNELASLPETVRAMVG